MFRMNGTPRAQGCAGAVPFNFARYLTQECAGAVPFNFARYLTQVCAGAVPFNFARYLTQVCAGADCVSFVGIHREVDSDRSARRMATAGVGSYYQDRTRQESSIEAPGRACAESW